MQLEEHDLADGPALCAEALGGKAHPEHRDLFHFTAH